jgi:hypothetical protein
MRARALVLYEGPDFPREESQGVNIGMPVKRSGKYQAPRLFLVPAWGEIACIHPVLYKMNVRLGTLVAEEVRVAL